MYRRSSCDICSTCPRNHANGSSSCSELKLLSPALQVLGSLCIANLVGGESVGSQIIVREKYADRILECVAHLAKSSSSKVVSNACLVIVIDSYIFRASAGGIASWTAISITEDEQSEQSLDEEIFAARALYEYACALGKDFEGRFIEGQNTDLFVSADYYCLYSLDKLCLFWRGPINICTCFVSGLQSCLSTASEDQATIQMGETCMQLFNLLSKALISQL
ncbi:LOW QUALITY PROTEIN: hypothetical protein ACHAWX_003654 [Stephanocyclus meneghinianus]